MWKNPLEFAKENSIREIEFSEDGQFLTLWFNRVDQNIGIRIHDDAQHCCEERYMSTDCDISNYIGGRIYDIRLDGEGWIKTGEFFQEHDIAFLNIVTSKGVLTIDSHNIHNGAYDGFDISLYLVVKDSQKEQ